MKRIPTYMRVTRRGALARKMLRRYGWFRRIAHWI